MFVLKRLYPLYRPLSNRGLFTSLCACAKVRGQNITKSAIFLQQNKPKRVDRRHHNHKFYTILNSFLKTKSCLRVVLLIAQIERPKIMSWLFIAFQKPKKEERNGYKL